MRQLQAIKALRMNYTRRGVIVWLKGRGANTGLRGWQLILRYPQSVENEQRAIAEGVFP